MIKRGCIEFKGVSTSLLVLLLFTTFGFAQIADRDSFIEAIESKIDISALKENPIVNYGSTDSLISIIDRDADSVFHARFFNLLGQFNFERGDYAVALEYFLTGRSYISPLANSPLFAQISINIGNVYYKNEDFESAKKLYNRGRTLAFEFENFGLAATASNNIALLHLRSKEFADAEFYFKEAFQLRKKLNNGYLVAHSLQYLGMLNFHQGKLDSAIYFYRQSEQLVENTKVEKELKLLITVKNDLAFSLLKKNNVSSVNNKVAEVEELLKGIDDQYFYCSAMYQVANIYFKTKKFEKALETSRNVIEVAGLENYFDALQKGYNLASQIEEELGNFKSAVVLSRKSQRIKSKLRKNFTDKKLANERYAQSVLGSKKLLNLANRESELKTRELNSQRRVTEFLVLVVIMGLIAVLSLVYSNRHKQRSNKQLLATNQLIEKQNVAIKKQQFELHTAKSDLELKLNELKQLTKDNNQLLSMVAHDLRTPLNSIKGLNDLLKIELLESENKNNQDELQYIEMINKSVNNMLRMIEQLLHSKNFDDGEVPVNKSNINLNKLIQEMIANHKKWANEKNIEIVVNQTDTPTILLTDPILFEQIISNILSNAIKFSPHKSQVIIEIIEKTTVVSISVKDYGPGFSDSDKEKLFKPYQKLSANPTGGESSFGVGLSSAKKMSEELNGKLWVKSTQGNGATFYFQLPKKTV